MTIGRRTLDMENIMQFYRWMDARAMQASTMTGAQIAKELNMHRRTACRLRQAYLIVRGRGCIAPEISK